MYTGTPISYICVDVLDLLLLVAIVIVIVVC